MKIYNNEMYLCDVRHVANSHIPWNKLQHKSILISGASGLLGSFLIDVLMHCNKYKDMNCKIYALGRDARKANIRFEKYWKDSHFEFIAHDINQPLYRDKNEVFDYVIHLASNTHPVAYATDPIGTVTTNIIGTNNMLDFAVKHKATRFAFASSNEIYGENRGDTEKFDENYCGYINSNTLRAGYTESKRCGESLCQAYLEQKNLDIVIPRLTRCYGPTMLKTDTKAISQFIRKGVDGENIVLKSDGTQYYSYIYMSDAVSGLLTILLCGNSGEAYNIADDASDIKLRDLARLVAKIAGKKVSFELPDKLERNGYSKVTKARLDSSKLQSLGWKAQYNIIEGMTRTIQILQS